VSSPANPTGSAHLRPGGDPAQRWSYSFSDGAFVRRVLIIIALGALAALVWRLAHVLLLGFGAVVVAVILRALADIIAKYVRLQRNGRLHSRGC
jgi:hypothetical protein